MMYYAVLDTNVLISAMLKNNSVPGMVVAEALRGNIIPLINNEIIAEYEEVLSRPKFSFDSKSISVFLQELNKRAVFVESDMIEYEIPDSDDAVFYAVLMEKRKDTDAYLVTGNMRHFPVRTYIVTPKEMLDIIREER